MESTTLEPEFRNKNWFHQCNSNRKRRCNHQVRTAGAEQDAPEDCQVHRSRQGQSDPARNGGQKIQLVPPIPHLERCHTPQHPSPVELLAPVAKLQYSWVEHGQSSNFSDEQSLRIDWNTKRALDGPQLLFTWSGKPSINGVARCDSTMLAFHQSYGYPICGFDLSLLAKSTLDVTSHHVESHHIASHYIGTWTFIRIYALIQVGP